MRRPRCSPSARERTRATTSATSTTRTTAPATATSLSDHLDEDALRAPAVELAVEDLLPRTEVELAVRHRDDDLAAHDLALVVGVAVVLARAVVMVALGRRVVRREPLEPA